MQPGIPSYSHYQAIDFYHVKLSYWIFWVFHLLHKSNSTTPIYGSEQHDDSWIQISSITLFLLSSMLCSIPWFRDIVCPKLLRIRVKANELSSVLDGIIFNILV